MIDEREIVRRATEALTPPEPSFDRLLQRRDRVQRNRRIQAGVLGIAVAIAVGWWGIEAIRSTPPVPADRSEELGIFAPVAGRILFVNEDEVAVAGYDPGPWAIDPSGPADTTAGPRVADDVVSTLVPLGPEDAIPLDWSSDGTELLFERMHGDLIVQQDLYILHSDGSETLLVRGYGGSAAIAPDGSRVVFSGGCGQPLCVIDADGGQPAPLLYPSAEDAYAPTFSPDGTQIAFLVHEDDDLTHVWVANADGSGAREILAAEETRSVAAGGLQWSPAGDRLAFGVRGFEGNGDVSSIYTFAPDGSNFTRVITGGDSPHWSPDGSQIAYTINCTEGQASCADGSIVLTLAIADADGSNVRAFGFAASGPWHPAASAPIDEPAPPPAPTESVLRRAGEVLLFTGTAEVDLDHNAVPGDLVAVDPATGEERVLVEDLDDVSYARWSADGRWVAFERGTTRGRPMPGSLWVVDGSREPWQVLDGAWLWAWSSTGARLAVIHGSTLSVVDPSTDRMTELASTVGDVTSAPAWSPDGTRIVFGARGGSISSVDVRTGEHSRLVQLPGEDLDSVDGIEWSPDGSRLVILYHLGTGDGRLVVMNADGSDITVLAEGELGWFDWSPDGSRIAFTEMLRVFVAPADGSTTSLVASLPNDARTSPVWSPDGSQIALGARIAFLTEDAPNLVIDADGSGDAVPLDDLTYESWRGGSYDCDCDLFG